MSCGRFLLPAWSVQQQVSSLDVGWLCHKGPDTVYMYMYIYILYILFKENNKTSYSLVAKKQVSLEVCSKWWVLIFLCFSVFNVSLNYQTCSKLCAWNASFQFLVHSVVKVTQLKVTHIMSAMCSAHIICKYISIQCWACAHQHRHESKPHAVYIPTQLLIY